MTQPNCGTVFTQSYSTFVFAFSSFVGTSTLWCGNRHLSPALQPDYVSQKWHSGACQYSQGDLVQGPTKKYLQGCRRIMPGLLLPLTLLFLDILLPRVIDGSESVAAFGVAFCARSLLSCRKLHWSPFEHCPFSFHWLHKPFPPSTPLNPFRFLPTAPVSIFPCLSSKFRNRSS